MREKELFLKRGVEERAKGNLAGATYFFNRYLQHGGDDEEIILWLADRYIEEGKARKAVGFLKRMARRLNYPRVIIDRLATIMEEMGALSELEEFANQIPYAEEFLKSLHYPFPDKYSDEELMEILNLFSGREGVHAKMWVSSQGKVGYSPVKAPVNIPLLKKHLAGKYTIGIYQLKLNNTVNWAVFDLDISFKFLRKALENGEIFDRFMKEMLDFSQAFREKLEKVGLKSYIEESGFKGYHVWMFFRDPINAGTVKEFMEKEAGQIQLPPHLHLEIFPKNSYVPRNGYGNLVKFPGGVHLKTGRRSYFLGSENLVDFVKKVEKISLSDFKRKFWNLRKKEGERLPVPLILEQSAELKALRNGCSVIDSIIDKILRMNPISAVERKVLEHTVGHLEEGPQIIKELYSMIGYESPLKKPHRGNPISCARIKKELKYLTASLPCDCVFPYDDTYPNPLLHLREAKTPKEIEYLIRKFLFLTRQKKDIEEKLLEIEEEIQKKIREGQRISTKYGSLEIRDGRILIEIA